MTELETTEVVGDDSKALQPNQRTSGQCSACKAAKKKMCDKRDDNEDALESCQDLLTSQIRDLDDCLSEKNATEQAFMDDYAVVKLDEARNYTNWDFSLSLVLFWFIILLSI